MLLPSDIKMRDIPIDFAFGPVKDIAPTVETLMSQSFSCNYWENDCFSLISIENPDSFRLTTWRIAVLLPVVATHRSLTAD
jgi:hypothetical protein